MSAEAVGLMSGETGALAPESGWFDAHGRLRPRSEDVVYSPVDRRYFCLADQEVARGEVFQRTLTYLQVEAAAIGVSQEQYAARLDGLRARTLSDPRMAGLFSGVALPFLLPLGTSADLGALLQHHFLPAVARSFQAKFPQFQFLNQCAEGLLGQLNPLPELRYQELLLARTTRSLVGWYFPVALAGFAIPSQRALEARLPAGVILSGPLEAALALIGTPGLLMNSQNYPNLLALSAVASADVRSFHFFEAYGWNLTFNRRSMVGPVSEYFAGGLTIFT